MPESRPLIAVIGSIDTSRSDYRPPLRDVEQAETACRELGQGKCSVVLWKGMAWTRPAVAVG
jgi:hypothetical protein